MENGEKNKKKLINIMRWWVKKVFFTNPQGFDSLSLSFTIHSSIFYYTTKGIVPSLTK